MKDIKFTIQSPWEPEEETRVQTSDWKGHGLHHATVLKLKQQYKRNISLIEKTRQHMIEKVSYLQVSLFAHHSAQYQAPSPETNGRHVTTNPRGSVLQLKWPEHAHSILDEFSVC